MFSHLQHTDFAIANVQCQYEESDSSDTVATVRSTAQHYQHTVTGRGIPEEHNYNSREPPDFVIQHPSSSSSQTHPSNIMTSLPGELNLIRVDGTQTTQQSTQPPPREYMFSKRVRRSESVLRAAADCVRRGLTFQNVSEQFHIPISTIRFFMARKGILPRRKRGRAIQIDRGSEVGRYCTSPEREPPYHMQSYKLPNMLALNDDTSS